MKQDVVLKTKIFIDVLEWRFSELYFENVSSHGVQVTCIQRGMKKQLDINHAHKGIRPCHQLAGQVEGEHEEWKWMKDEAAELEPHHHYHTKPEQSWAQGKVCTGVLHPCRLEE